MSIVVTVSFDCEPHEDALEPALLVERFFRNHQFADIFVVHAPAPYFDACEEWSGVVEKKDVVYSDILDVSAYPHRLIYRAHSWAVPNAGLQLWLEALKDEKVNLGVEGQFSEVCVPRMTMDGPDGGRAALVAQGWEEERPLRLPLEFHEVFLGPMEQRLNDLRGLPLTSQWWAVTDAEAQLGAEREWEREKSVWEHLLFMLHASHVSLGSDPEEPEDEDEPHAEDPPEDGVVNGADADASR